MKEEFQNKTLSETKPKKGGGLKKQIIDHAVGFLLGCDFGYTTQGSSSLGVPCKYGGCITIEC